MIFACSPDPTSASPIPFFASEDQLLTPWLIRGDVALITRPSFADPSAPWVLQRTWTAGHVGVVRAALWDERVRYFYISYIHLCLRAPPEQNNVLLTGGEDSKLHVWNAPAATPEVSSPGSKRVNDVDPMDVDEDGDSNRKKRRA